MTDGTQHQSDIKRTYLSVNQGTTEVQTELGSSERNFRWTSVACSFSLAAALAVAAAIHCWAGSYRACCWFAATDMLL